MKKLINIRKPFFKKAIVFITVLFVMQQQSFGQQPLINEPDQSLPAAFDNAPDTLSANIGMLNLIFNQPAGQRMILQLSDRFSMEGVLVSVAQKADGAIQSFRFTPENFPGTSFVFSKTLDQNGSVVYHGFITGRYIKDCYQLVKENNRYYFIKKNIYTLRSE